MAKGFSVKILLGLSARHDDPQIAMNNKQCIFVSHEMQAKAWIYKN
jgi:hypothetical protein